MVQAALRVHPRHITGPADLLEHVNAHLCGRQIAGFVTALVGIYEPLSRQLARNTADGAVARFDAVGRCPLGIDADQEFDEAVIAMRPGETVLLYTGGITEAAIAAIRCSRKNGYARLSRHASTDRPG
jgi:serine phosphatase RsbU (regulator of sigma subunit)